MNNYNIIKKVNGRWEPVSKNPLKREECIYILSHGKFGKKPIVKKNDLDLKNLKITGVAPSRTILAKEEHTGRMVEIENPEYTKIKRDLEGNNE